MNNEQLLQMYKALSENPGELVKAAARKRLINFARYMQPDLVLEPFHVVYYTLLDMFAHGKIRTTTAATWKIGGVEPKVTRFHGGIEPGFENSYRVVCCNHCTRFQPGRSTNNRHAPVS